MSTEPRLSDNDRDYIEKAASFRPAGFLSHTREKGDPMQSALARGVLVLAERLTRLEDQERAPLDLTALAKRVEQLEATAAAGVPAVQVELTGELRAALEHITAVATNLDERLRRLEVALGEPAPVPAGDVVESTITFPDGAEAILRTSEANEREVVGEVFSGPPPAEKPVGIVTTTPKRGSRR